MNFFKKFIKKNKKKKMIFTNQRTKYLDHEIGDFTYGKPNIDGLVKSMDS